MTAETDGIRVNMTEQEAKSEDREPLPIGKYHLKITDMDIMFVKDQDANGNTNKNAGKPYINFEFTVQDGPLATRRDWTNAMCFEGALYTISQILKALGHDVPEKGGFAIPTDRETYIGKDLWGRRGTNQKDKNTDGSLRVQLRGFSKYEGGASTTSGASAKSSAGVLP
jgi:hypothetical protein